ncbi:MAG: hypothetical protein AB7I30_02825 [Isosphaeraceae bacterium]
MSGNGQAEARPIPPGSGAAPDVEGISGRRFVLACGFGVLFLWGALYLTFSVWRSSYRARASFGEERVAKAVEPLAEVIPDPSTGVTAESWRPAVAETREMLKTLTAANLLDLSQMAALGEWIAREVADATPSTALETLARIWDEAEARAGPVIARRHKRPPWLSGGSALSSQRPRE